MLCRRYEYFSPSISKDTSGTIGKDHLSITSLLKKRANRGNFTKNKLAIN